MKLIVGLGNPGSKYEFTRHNAGFMAIDELAKSFGLQFKPAKGDWWGVESEINNQRFYLMKPSTFMNASGNAVYYFLKEKKIPLSDVLVIYDDFQLPLGTIRVRANGSDGGHNGISSIIYSLETLEFPRMRIGIGSEKTVNTNEYVDFVLSRFSNEEAEKLKIMTPIYKDCILCFIEEGIFITMNKYNKNFIQIPQEEEQQDLNNAPTI